jgi:L,D-transpeptidase YcbB
MRGMRRLVPICIPALLLAIAACTSGGEQPRAQPLLPIEELLEVNEVFETNEPYSPKRLDSLEIEDFLSAHPEKADLAEAVRGFYQRRDGQYAWFVSDTLSVSATSFLALVNSADTLHARVAKLRQPIDSLMHATGREIKDLELSLTLQFFHYARSRYGGLVRSDLKELDWYIPRRKKNFDRLLDSLVHGAMDLSAVEPLHPQYFRLKEHLKLYNGLVAHAWDSLTLDGRRKLEPGQQAALVPLLRQRLSLLGDLTSTSETDSTPPSLEYDSLLVKAVMRFQERHGLLQDGVIGKGVLAALNVSPQARLRTLLVNMERLRWMPEETEPDLLLVNIPEFKLHVYENGEEVLSMEVVVGTEATRTVIFSDTMTYLVFSPTWTIPESITRNEILPAMEKDPNYLQKKNMEIIGGSKSRPVVRQKPGTGNALGRVKFMFPNSYSIYLHDTPAKSLFAREQRAFSHGCIRVSKPVELAAYLLRNDTSWTPARIKEAMDRKSELNVGLKEPRPVMIGYFTAWVDREGLLHFRPDIYGHDGALERELFASESTAEIAAAREDGGGSDPDAAGDAVGVAVR